jgi:hypothetical protein
LDDNEDDDDDNDGIIDSLELWKRYNHVSPMLRYWLMVLWRVSPPGDPFFSLNMNR